MRYFVDPQGKLRGACVSDNPVNPDGWGIVEIEGDLPAPMERLTYANGVLSVDPDYHAEAEEARAAIRRIEAQNPVPQRALRELAGVLARALPAAAELPGVKALLDVEAQISPLRGRLKGK